MKISYSTRYIWVVNRCLKSFFQIGMDKQTGVSVRFDLETRPSLKGLLFVMLNESLS